MAALLENGVFTVPSVLPTPRGAVVTPARMRCLPTGVNVPLLHLAFSPRGRMLAAGTESGRVRLWSLPAGGLATFSPRQAGSIRAVAFLSDNLLATAGGDWLRGIGELRLWDCSGGGEEQTIWQHTSPVTALALSPDGSRLAAGAGDGSIGIWDTLTRSLVAESAVHDDEVLDLAWSPDGVTLASAGADHRVCLLDADLSLRGVLQGHDQAVRSVAFAPQGDRLASVDDSGLHLWDAVSGSALHRRSSLRGGLRAVCFTPTGAAVLTVGALRQGQAELRYWELAGDSRVLYRHRSGLSSLALAPDGRAVAMADQMGEVLLWPVEEKWD